MSDIPDIDAGMVDELLGALGEQLAVRNEQHTIAVAGGSALIALGLVPRATRDIDVVAVLDEGDLISADPLPAGLIEAARTVAADFGLPALWLNAGPSSLLDFGLPAGFLQRTVRRRYGESLLVLFASRLDQIHFKLYATVDQGAGRHLADLEALEPNEEELLQAAQWSESHDASDGYREVLLEVLAHFGVEHGPSRA